MTINAFLGKQGFTIGEGLVNDPFYPATAIQSKQYYLVRSADFYRWAWINPDSQNIIYLQEYKPSINKIYVYSFPKGIVETPLTAYDFQIFNCQIAR